MSTCRRLGFAAGLLSVAGLASGLAAQACKQGAWEPAFDHGGVVPAIPDGAYPVLPGMGFPVGDFMAMHVSVIPKGPHQGHLLVWDVFHYEGSPVGQVRVHRWAIVDPVNRLFWNANRLLPPDMGDLACSGHGWTADGDLLVVGGTGCHGHQTGCGHAWGGSRLAYLWRPPTEYGGTGIWLRISPDLDAPRWYPSVLALDTDPSNVNSDPMAVLGGTHLGTAVNSYQVWLPGSGSGSWKQHRANATRTFLGPGNGSPTAPDALGDYPRAHWISSRHMATAGMLRASSRVDPHSAQPETWSAIWSQAQHRVQGSSILYPISPGGIPYKDFVMSIGGRSDPLPYMGTILAAVEACNAGAPNPGWTPMTPLAHARWCLNAVLLPDSSVLVVGGEKQYRRNGCSEVPALVPEVYMYGGWLQMAPGTICRDYHSAAVLLPSGKVMVCGGESRHYGPWQDCQDQTGRTKTVFPADYQVFVPHYVHCGFMRPVIRNQAAAGGYWTWNRSGIYDIEHDPVPPGLSISRAVLVRPGSATHHIDANQRCVELHFTHNAPGDAGRFSIRVTVPSQASSLLPRGIYMLFLVTDQGVPSVAAWVKVTA